MINEILRLHSLGLGKDKIAAALKISPNTAKKYIRQNLETQKIPAVAKLYSAPWAELVDWSEVKSATDRGKQLKHYHEEHLTLWTNPPLADVPYVTFWREFRRRYPDIPLEMHKIHPPGERCEIDYKGDSPGLGFIDRVSGEFMPCRFFGAILCFSQMFYGEATLTETQPDLLGALARAYRYFEGVPHTSAVDNAKAGVSKAHQYDPDFNPEFFHFCAHFGTAPLAMRPGKPKDKNLIENALGVFWRWAAPQIHARQFFSLGELNQFLREILHRFNSRVQRKYGLSRLEKFVGEKTMLLPLPAQSYEGGMWKKPILHPDCHVQIDHNFYSAPYQLRGKTLEARVTPRFIEIFSKLERIALHRRSTSSVKGRYTTERSHLPEAHLAVKEFSVVKLLEDAAAIGPSTEQVIGNLINRAVHPLMYMRRCQGIMRLRTRYCPQALEEACATLLSLNQMMPRFNDVEGVIKHGLSAPKAAEVIRKDNPNLRGQKSWQTRVH